MNNEENFTDSHVGNKYLFKGYQLDGDAFIHQHWGFVVGNTYEVKDLTDTGGYLGLVDDTGQAAYQNWNFELELVTENK